MRKNRYIKILSIVLCVLCLICAFAGCNNSGNKGKGEPNGEVTEPPISEMKGEFCTLQEAYDNGFLTDNDIMHISYFMGGTVYKIKESANAQGEQEWEEIDFEPQKQLSKLPETIENQLKTNFYSNNPYWFKNVKGEEIGNADDVRLTSYGKYGDAYVVGIEFTFMGYGNAMIKERLGNYVLFLNIPLVRVCR